MFDNGSDSGLMTFLAGFADTLLFVDSITLKGSRPESGTILVLAGRLEAIVSVSLDMVRIWQNSK